MLSGFDFERGRVVTALVRTVGAGGYEEDGEAEPWEKGMESSRESRRSGSFICSELACYK